MRHTDLTSLTVCNWIEVNYTLEKAESVFDSLDRVECILSNVL